MPKSCLTPAAFNKLPSNKKAVLIAKDVIKQIKASNFQIETGYYLHIPNRPKLASDYNLVSTASPEGKEIITNAGCIVCAKGAIFLSAIMHSNKMSIGELSDTHGFIPLDRKVCIEDGIFSHSNFSRIEDAFEGFGCATRFHDLFDNTTDRLVAICLNIIKNNGTFLSNKNIPTLKQVKYSLRSPKKKTP